MSSSFPCNNSEKPSTAKNVLSILCGIIYFYLQTHTHTHTRTHVGCWNVDAPCDLTPACKVTNSIMSNSLYLNQACVCVCVCVFGCKIACLSSIWLCPKDRQDKVHPCTYPLTSLINKTRTHTQMHAQITFPLLGRLGSRLPGWPRQPSPWWLRLPRTLLLIKTMAIWGIVTNWKHISQRG